MWTADNLKIGDRIHCKSQEQRGKVSKSLERQGIITKYDQVHVYDNEFDFMLTVLDDAHFTTDWNADTYSEVE